MGAVALNRRGIAADLLGSAGGSSLVGSEVVRVRGESRGGARNLALVRGYLSRKSRKPVCRELKPCILRAQDVLE